MSALLLVDVQHDFIDGSLAVPGASDILPVVYQLLDNTSSWDLVVATQDFHPPGHISFASTHESEPFRPIRVTHPIALGLTGTPADARERAAAAGEEGAEETITQMLWPDHCVQGTRGCQFDEGVRSRMDACSDKLHVIQKGDHPLVDGYSAFAMNHYVHFTPLVRLLHEHRIRKLTIAGLATDYCVKATAVDARKFNFDVDVVRAGVRAVDSAQEAKVLAELERWGCRLV